MAPGHGRAVVLKPRRSPLPRAHREAMVHHAHHRVELHAVERVGLDHPRQLGPAGPLPGPLLPREHPGQVALPRQQLAAPAHHFLPGHGAMPVVRAALDEAAKVRVERGVGACRGTATRPGAQRTPGLRLWRQRKAPVPVGAMIDPFVAAQIAQQRVAAGRPRRARGAHPRAIVPRGLLPAETLAVDPAHGKERVGVRLPERRRLARFRVHGRTGVEMEGDLGDHPVRHVVGPEVLDDGVQGALVEPWAAVRVGAHGAAWQADFQFARELAVLARLALLDQVPEGLRVGKTLRGFRRQQHQGRSAGGCPARQRHARESVHRIRPGAVIEAFAGGSAFHGRATDVGGLLHGIAAAAARQHADHVMDVAAEHGALLQSRPPVRACWRSQHISAPTGPSPTGPSDAILPRAPGPAMRRQPWAHACHTGAARGVAS